MKCFWVTFTIKYIFKNDCACQKFALRITVSLSWISSWIVSTESKNHAEGIKEARKGQDGLICSTTPLLWNLQQRDGERKPLHATHNACSLLMHTHTHRRNAGEKLVAVCYLWGKVSRISFWIFEEKSVMEANVIPLAINLQPLWKGQDMTI